MLVIPGVSRGHHGMESELVFATRWCVGHNVFYKVPPCVASGQTSRPCASTESGRFIRTIA